MMKKISSIITLLFIACSIILGGGSALAADDPAIAPAEGSLTIHKYLYDEEGVSGVISDGKQLNDIPDELDGKEIRGVQFDVYKVGDAITQGAPIIVPGGDGWTYKKTENEELEVTNGTVTYQYTISGKQEGTTGDDGSIKFPSLARGYYFVVENLANSNPEMKNKDGKWEKVGITKPVKPFVVAVPMTDPENLNDWITDVHVYPKNQTTDVVKEPSKPSVNVGDEFSWSIAVELPADIKDYLKFIVTDNLDAALTYTDGSVKVYRAEKVDGQWEKVEPGGELVKDTDFTLTEPTGKGGTLKVELLESGFAAVDGWEGLIVEFNTKVNEDLEGKEVNIIGNTATVDFTNSHGQDSKKDSNTSEVNVGDVIIDKVDGKTGDELKGSEFQIARNETEAKEGKFIKITVDGAGKITGFVYPGSTNPDYASAEDWIVKPHSETAGDFTRFEGLETHTLKADGSNDYKSYWVVETKAPKDYNLLGDPVEVDFSKSEKDDDGKLTYNLTKEIENSTGFTLPNTGGIGTMLLVIVGIVLVGLAIILNMNNKKKKA